MDTSHESHEVTIRTRHHTVTWRCDDPLYGMILDDVIEDLIRPMLLAAGYAERDVDRALGLVNDASTDREHEHTERGKTHDAYQTL